MATPHIGAQKGAFAKTVLLPGDPLRAKFIAERYLDNVEVVSTVRNMLAFTGYYKGKRISIMGSGMGIPSIAIYSHELFNYYDVNTIIRIGSVGGYSEKCNIYDIIIVSGASTNSNFAAQFKVGGQLSALADFALLKKADEYAKKNNIKYHVGQILSSDVFYNADKEAWQKWARLGCLGVEMESYALYINATLANKKALSICTVSDSFIHPGEVSIKDKEQNFIEMAEIALEIAE